MAKIDYPYLPEGRTILYAPADNAYMLAARDYARDHSLDDTVQTGSVVVKNNMIIGQAANGSEYHKTHVCERVRLNMPTGQGYELCEGCHPKNHSEPNAIRDAKGRGFDTEGADIYLWGHWWACKSCWDAMNESGIKNYYLLEGSERFFNKSHPKNIIGRQFA